MAFKTDMCMLHACRLTWEGWAAWGGCGTLMRPSRRYETGCSPPMRMRDDDCRLYFLSALVSHACTRPLRHTQFGSAPCNSDCLTHACRWPRKSGGRRRQRRQSKRAPSPLHSSRSTGRFFCEMNAFRSGIWRAVSYPGHWEALDGAHADRNSQCTRLLGAAVVLDIRIVGTTTMLTCQKRTQAARILRCNDTFCSFFSGWSCLPPDSCMTRLLHLHGHPAMPTYTCSK
eukprot:357080-Chlamydomonas_euryale.AAC.2